MEILEAWSALRALGPNPTLAARNAGILELQKACKEMRKETVKVTCRKYASYVANNCRHEFYGACDDVLIEVADRLIANEPDLTDENPAGYLQSLMIWKCELVADVELKGIWASSYRYKDIKHELAKLESLGDESHDLPYEERGFQIVDASDFVEATYTEPLEQMIVERVKDECAIVPASIGRALGCDDETISSKLEGVALRARRKACEYAIGV